ncbi:YggS family pyridoxal phosphate-dependent enzyme [Micromonospora echinaurantiaca]|uniref:YggS family pyridoxal phosphate-dependent enzyme n=1 Tax=Micromonospora TaxID=1873 RepID=UPI000D6F87C8|nr:YggS family pyridoxal phosphate-dependent enzyme [Micromonospora sp. S4605]PWU56405.1 YggS family pyridoxal phosphate-dependent enzyme [Micromonospora sp. S4605]
MSDSPAAVRPDRRAELAAGLARVRSRIADACTAAGRDRAEITMIAVTKTYPAGDVVALAGLGVTDVGENRDQEAAPKAAEVAAAGVTPRWHFIGRLQRNKARSVVRYADAVHSVDSVRLARAVDAASAAGRDRPLDVLVQVSIDGDAARGGALPGSADPDVGLDRVAEAVAGAEALRLTGLMAVAPLGWEPERAFARLAELAAAFRSVHPGATALSAGMSGDLEVAIGYGATHVRVGSALLGMRPTLR